MLIPRCWQTSDKMVFWMKVVLQSVVSPRDLSIRMTIAEGTAESNWGIHGIE